VHQHDTGSSRGRAHVRPLHADLSAGAAGGDEAAIDAAVAGIGVTRLLSYQVAEAVARGALRIVLEQYEREPISVSILHAGPGMLPLKVRIFRDFAVPRLRAAMGSAKLNPPSQPR
jgi:DNA-binding transcriptional LysR family regulator